VGTYREVVPTLGISYLSMYASWKQQPWAYRSWAHDVGTTPALPTHVLFLVFIEFRRDYLGRGESRERERDIYIYISCLGCLQHQKAKPGAQSSWKPGRPHRNHFTSDSLPHILIHLHTYIYIYVMRIPLLPTYLATGDEE